MATGCLKSTDSRPHGNARPVTPLPDAGKKRPQMVIFIGLYAPAYAACRAHAVHPAEYFGRAPTAASWAT